MATDSFASSSAQIGFARYEAAAGNRKPLAAGANTRAVAEDFESSFLSTMFNQMFSGLEGDGPLGSGQSVGVWRSFLTDEYAKSFAKSGGIGLSDQIYRELIAQQESGSQ